MAQSKAGSLAEAGANILVGFTVNFFCNWIFLPMLGQPMMSAKTNFLFGCLMTGVSLARSYILRRYFNGLKFGQVKA